jgi:hypothetical protein
MIAEIPGVARTDTGFYSGIIVRIEDSELAISCFLTSLGSAFCIDAGFVHAALVKSCR